MFPRSLWPYAAFAFLAVCLTVSLAVTPGFFEYGDVNYPLKMLSPGVFLPWDPTIGFGFDNTYINLPRVTYGIMIDGAIALFHDHRFAQFALFAFTLFFGMAGSYRLALQASADRFVSFALAIFFVCNPWIEQRLNQFVLIIAYFAVPWLLREVIRASEKGINYRGLALMGLIAPFLLNSLQMAYMAALCCAITAIIFFIQHETSARIHFIRNLSIGFCAAVFTCSFFVFPALSQAIHGSSHALSNVAHHFSFDSYRFLASNESILNVLRFTGYYYGTWATENSIRTSLTWIYPLTLLFSVIFLTRRRAYFNFRNPIFICSLANIGLAALMMSGTYYQPFIVQPLRELIPGLHVLTDPDYFGSLYLLGMLLFFSTLRSRIAVVLLLLASIGSAVSMASPSGSFQKVVIPSEYAKASDVKSDGSRALWLPARWVNRYDWSPYFVANFPSILTSSPFYGPSTLEFTADTSRAYVDQLLDALDQRNLQKATWLLDAASTSKIVVQNDIVDTRLVPFSPEEKTRNTKIMSFLSSHAHSKSENIVFNSHRLLVIDRNHYIPLLSFSQRFVQSNATSDPTAVSSSPRDLPVVISSTHFSAPQAFTLQPTSPTIDSKKRTTWIAQSTDAKNITIHVDNTPIHLQPHISTLIHGQSITMEPNQRTVEYFSPKTWTKGACSPNVPSNADWNITLNRSLATGYSRMGTFCIQHAFQLQSGHILITDTYRSNGAAPRALIIMNGTYVPLEINAAGTLTASFTLHSAVTAHMYLYFDPSLKGKVQYEAPSIASFSSSGVILRMPEATRPSHASPIAWSQSLLAFDTETPPCSQVCVLLGNWTYGDGWHATLNGHELEHVRANTYANGWIIPQNAKGHVHISYTGTLEYLIGIAVSAFCFCFFLLASIIRVPFFRRPIGTQT